MVAKWALSLCIRIRQSRSRHYNKSLHFNNGAILLIKKSFYGYVLRPRREDLVVILVIACSFTETTWDVLDGHLRNRRSFVLNL